ncbi:MAG: hypothetical protein Hyperionvirus20_2 [Hyperionvirus sp.]|uniref:Uncharacterized protein n=1 Tax=Hyperionvirus sp. TaxID=2487770 RepID=A0A3G5ACB0_9VIRU|nr:MAG: hypothetical protein Hyperionvirus20_2 [Hyperionvirus sp.]
MQFSNSWLSFCAEPRKSMLCLPAISLRVIGSIVIVSDNHVSTVLKYA